MTGLEFCSIIDQIIKENQYRWHEFACGISLKFCSSIGIENVKHLIDQMGTEGAQNYIRENWEQIKINSNLDNKWASILPLQYSANEFLKIDDENTTECIYGIIEFMEMSGMNDDEIIKMVRSVSVKKT